MPRVRLDSPLSIFRSPRVLQIEGMFDLDAECSIEETWISLPYEERDWNVGFVVGPSGSGKTTICRQLVGDLAVKSPAWRSDRAMIDDFPAHLGIRRITTLLSAAGLNAPPCWLRPFATLSGGEQFRAKVARVLAESGNPMFIDEFTSTVDRRVARHASCSLARLVRAEGQRLIVAGCHEDVMDWLEPDWVCATDGRGFHWRLVRRRPAITLRLRRVTPRLWRLFQGHHYLTGKLHPSARCYASFVDGAPAAFTAVIPFPHPRRPGWREHRLVCLPEFQGLGIGHAHADHVAGMYHATGKPYYSTTSNPAMIRHRARSPRWRMSRSPSLAGMPRLQSMRSRASRHRWTASFQYIGAAHPEDAAGFGLRVPFRSA